MSVPSKFKVSPVDRHIGSRISQLRQSVSMDQVQLASYLSWPLAQVQNYENGSERIGASRLAALAKALHVNDSYFFEGAPLYEEPLTDIGAVLQRNPGGEIRECLAADLTEMIEIFLQIESHARRRALLDYARTQAQPGEK